MGHAFVLKMMLVHGEDVTPEHVKAASARKVQAAMF